MAGSKGKSKGGSGIAGDKRGGIAKAKEQASRSGGDTAGSAEARGAAKAQGGGHGAGQGGESRGGKKADR